MLKQGAREKVLIYNIKNHGLALVSYVVVTYWHGQHIYKKGGFL